MVILKIDHTTISMIIGDITEQNLEAIVNAANSSLMGGSGVDGAIHRAGGTEILEQCKQIRKNQGKCPPGKAVITGGGNLKSDHVIHTVGPIWHGGDHDEDNILASAYHESLKLAAKNNIKSIAFPSISTGAYRFPMKLAARIALTTMKNYIKEHRDIFDEVRMVLYQQKYYDIYLSVWKEVMDNGEIKE